MGFELMTSSLPRMRSTPELHRLLWSGRRGSNSRPSAWKADALPTELLPRFSAKIALILAAPRNRKRLSLLSACTKFPQKYLAEPILCGGRWTRTTEPEGADLQSAAIAAMRSPQVSRKSLRRLEPKEGFEPTTPRLQITCSGQLSYFGSISKTPFDKGTAKIGIKSDSPKLFQLFLNSSRSSE